MKSLWSVLAIVVTFASGCSSEAQRAEVDRAEDAPKIQTRKGMDVMGAEAQLTEAGMQGDSRVGSKLKD